MKKLMLAASAAALMALAMPMSANALTVIVNDMASPMTKTASTSYVPAMAPDKASLMSAMSHNTKVVAAIKKLGNNNDVQLVKVAKLIHANASAFAKSMPQDKTAIGDLRTAINGNSLLADALKSQNVAVNTIVGATLDDAGNLVIYSNS